jgi:hypothetical protein
VTLEAGDRAALREMVLAELRGGDLAVLVRQLQGAVLAVGGGGYRVQWGVTRVTFGAGGELDFTIALNEAWSAEHAVFLATSWAVPPLAWASVTPRGAQVFDLANGIAHAALGAAGSLDWTWLSIGK